MTLILKVERSEDGVQAFVPTSKASDRVQDSRSSIREMTPDASPLPIKHAEYPWLQLIRDRLPVRLTNKLRGEILTTHAVDCVAQFVSPPQRFS